MKERLATALSVGVVLLAVLACKGKAEDGAPDAAAAAPVETATAAASASNEPQASASAAVTPSASAVATAKPLTACHGLMIDKRCARECVKDTDCPDPKERCAPFSGSDDNGQDVQGAVVCQYDKDNEPRAAAPSAVPSAATAAVKTATVGVAAPAGGDCAKGWAPSVSEANKCDKECKTDADCGAGNKCKAVGPVGSGKQCQKG